MVMVTAGLLGLAACTGAGDRAVDDTPPTAEVHRAEVEAWRVRHETSYRAEYVTIAGLLPLRAGANTAGSAPGSDLVLPAAVPATLGRFDLTDDRVRFTPAPGVDVRLGDQPVTGPVDLRDDATEAPDELTVGDVSLVAHVSGTARMLRVRDPHGPWATGFRGFSWFPIDMQYRVVGHFTPDDEPQRVKIPNTFGDLDEFRTEGVVEFTLLGETVRLRPFTTRPNRLWFVFRDASSGAETYEAARFLYADLQPDGRVVLDFNMAYNPPCAFNPYTTCPIPMRENRLSSARILAGERAYPVKVEVRYLE
ncbi:MAG: hypothetical protein ABS36_17985 [Acidobacteria bacterium SCN 69-37]|nr:MAG: hypothetical protein ABS36_17985 [Acidobacteria bacterium SCN 69-37]